MQRQWFTGSQLTPGRVLLRWDRPFAVWGYTGSHSCLLLRSPKNDERANRIDLLFKPVESLSIRTGYRTLTVRVADAPHRPAVLELIGPDGSVDQIVCEAVGCHEDDGEDWEPSPFAQDLSDGVTPPWRRRVLGGGPDGEMTARYASIEELAAAIDADPPHRPDGNRGRFLYVSMMRIDTDRPALMGAFLTRTEADQHVQARGGPAGHSHGMTVERWVDVVPMNL